jgi:hypothetical protein
MHKQKNEAITDQNRSGTGQNKKGGWSMLQPPFGTFSVRGYPSAFSADPALNHPICCAVML